MSLEGTSTCLGLTAMRFGAAIYMKAVVTLLASVHEKRLSDSTSSSLQKTEVQFIYFKSTRFYFFKSISSAKT